MRETERKMAYVVNHKDGNFTKNNVDNLEYTFINTSAASEGNCYHDGIRNGEEIGDYLAEACDKAWLSHTTPCAQEDIESDRLRNIERILNRYNDIPEDGYTEWECGYWNGIMGALRWVLGEEKNFLDT